MNKSRTFAAAVTAATLFTVGCASSGGTKIAVSSTKDACKVAQTNLKAGELRFEVTNDGSQPTELYVLGEGDRVISEVENIGPGTSRTLSVNLKAGKYTLECKPGQRGNGIRQVVNVTGAGGKKGASG